MLYIKFLLRELTEILLEISEEKCDFLKGEFEKTISEYEFSAERIVDIFLSDLPA